MVDMKGWYTGNVDDGRGWTGYADSQRHVSPATLREIRELGFERYIRSYPDNDTMAFNPEFIGSIATL